MKKTIVMILALTVGMTAKAQTLKISDEAGLISFRTAVNNGTLEYSTIELTADIALTADWFPIGTSSEPFTATFDGKGHTISNINMEPKASETGFVSGLFGYIGSGGTVKNLIVNNTNQDHYIGIYKPESTNYIGAIAGLNYGTIEGCTNIGVEVRSLNVLGRSGGIAGDNYGTIDNCYNLYGVVYTGYNNNFLGGITGVNEGVGKVKNCFACAIITVDGSFDFTYSGPIYGNNLGTVTNNSYEDYSGTDFIIPGYTLYKDDHWNTLCLPFGLTERQVSEQLAPAALMELDTDNCSFDATNGTLYLNFKTAFAIEAGKPYIIKWASGENLNPTFRGVTKSCTSPQGITKSLGSGMSITFKGCFSPISVSGPSYLFLSSNDELYYPSSARTIGSCRAYFELSGLTAGDTENGEPDPVSGARSIRAFSLNFNDESTGIVEMRKEEGAGNHVNAALPEYFTINGVKLTGKPTAKGLYIRSTPAGQQGKKDSRIIVIK